MNSNATPQKNTSASADPIIDWRLLQERYSGKTALIERIIQAAHKAYQTTPQQLRQAVQQQDLDTLFQIAHGLKSAAGNLEAKQLYDSAIMILDNVRSNHGVALQVANELCVQLERFNAEIDAKLRKDG